jgi:hypothetical protein
MEHLPIVLAAVFTVTAAMMYWCSYQINYKGRTDLIRLGTVPLPGAAMLKSQFAWIFFLQGTASAAAAVIFVATNATLPTVWVFMVVTGAMSIRRSLLINGIEKYAEGPHREA